MRWVYLALLVAIVAIIVVFVVQNNENTTIEFFDRKFTAPLSWLFVGVYCLGMWSGGTVVGFLKRAYHRAAEDKVQKPAS